MADFPSQFDIGDPVFLVLGEHEIPAYVRCVTFTAGKVRYALRVPVGPEEMTSVHNVDSCCVTPRPDAVRLEMPMDNYS